MRKRCLARGCTNLISRGSYCETHKPYGGNWPRLREWILERDGYRCQVCGPLCVGAARTVDHINGNPLDNRPENLRAACRPCNSAKGGRL